MNLRISIGEILQRGLIVGVLIGASCLIPGMNGYAKADPSLWKPGRSFAAVPGDREPARTVERKPKKRIVGWLEDVVLIDAKIHLNAVMHTGIVVSAINAPNFKGFVRDGSIWVRFSIRKAGREAVTIERPVVSFYRLQTDGAPDKKRPIVKMKLCVAGYVEDADFILWDKAPKGYSIVLGRSFLARKFLIDPSRKFEGRGAC